MPVTLDRIAEIRAKATPEQLARLEYLVSWQPSPHQEELARCAADPVYWINHHCLSYDPRNPDPSKRIGPFILSPLQVSVIRDLQEADRTRSGTLWEKSRDSGATFMAGFYALWCWLFREGDATGFGSRKLDLVDSLGDPGCIFEKIRMTYRQLPDWMREAKSKGFVWSKHSTIGKFVNPMNGSTIIGEGGDNIGRGSRYSRYFVDEAAHIEHPKLINASLSQSTNVRHDISTPNGLDEFYTKRQSGLVKVIRMHWIDDPRKWLWEATDAFGNVVERGEGRHPTEPIPNAYETPQPNAMGITVKYPWYEGPNARLHPDYTDPASLAQEVDIDYVGSGRPVFNRTWLFRMRETVWAGNAYAVEWEPERIELVDRATCQWFTDEKIRRERVFEQAAWMGDLTTYVDPEPGHTYALLADTARGLTDGGNTDFSVFHLFDLETCEQVVHYRGQMTEHEFATDIATVACMYNNALVVVETPGPGETVLSNLSNVVKYRNIYSYWDDDAQTGISKKLGLPMTETTKPEGDGYVKSMLYDAQNGVRGAIVIRHPNTLEECVHYVYLTRTKRGAEAGGHDDEVACLRLLGMIWQTHTTRGKKPLADLVPRSPKTSAATMVGGGMSMSGMRPKAPKATGRMGRQ